MFALKRFLEGWDFAGPLQRFQSADLADDVVGVDDGLLRGFVNGDQVVGQHAEVGERDAAIAAQVLASSVGRDLTLVLPEEGAGHDDLIAVEVTEDEAAA